MAQKFDDKDLSRRFRRKAKEIWPDATLDDIEVVLAKVIFDHFDHPPEPRKPRRQS
jgi:hypothetical protein